MEFEKNTPASDEDRRLAETKKLTLEPLHTDIAPEDEPDAAIISRHLNAGALANAPNDTEQAQAPVKPSSGLLEPAEQPKTTIKRGKTVIVVVTILVATGIVLTAIGLSLQL